MLTLIINAKEQPSKCLDNQFGGGGTDFNKDRRLSLKRSKDGVNSGIFDIS